MFFRAVSQGKYGGPPAGTCRSSTQQCNVTSSCQAGAAQGSSAAFLSLGSFLPASGHDHFPSFVCVSFTSTPRKPEVFLCFVTFLKHTSPVFCCHQSYCAPDNRHDPWSPGSFSKNPHRSPNDSRLVTLCDRQSSFCHSRPATLPTVSAVFLRTLYFHSAKHREAVNMSSYRIGQFPSMLLALAPRRLNVTRHA